MQIRAMLGYSEGFAQAVAEVAGLEGAGSLPEPPKTLERLPGRVAQR